MSQHLDRLRCDDKIQIKGPAGPIIYHSNGIFTVHGSSVGARRISLIGGGTGITPLYQLARAMLSHSDETQLALLYANRSTNDILLRRELDELAATHPQRFKVWYTLDRKPNEPWQFDIGFINERMLKERIFSPAASSIVFLCGPPVMLEHACRPSLRRLGYSDDSVFEF